jgi:hypothetical protein
VEAVFGGIVCTPTRSLFVREDLGGKQVAAFAHADLDSVVLIEPSSWFLGRGWVQVIGKGAHAIAFRGSEQKQVAAARGVPNVMPFAGRAGKRDAAAAVEFLGRRIREAQTVV